MQSKTAKYPSYYVPSIKRATGELNLAVYTSIKESIDRTIQFYSDKSFNPNHKL